MYGEQAGERLLLPHRLQRALPPAGRARRTCDVEGLLKGLYRLRPAARPTATARRRRSILASRRRRCTWALEAQQLLAEDWGVAADVWSATSWTELRRDALACDEHNLLHPDAEQRVPYVTQAAVGGRRGRSWRVSDYMRAVPDQIAQWVPGDWTSLGTDGFGLSDTRRRCAATSTSTRPRSRWRVLTQLVRRGEVKAGVLSEAIARYHLKNGVTEAGGAESNDAQSMGL